MKTLLLIIIGLLATSQTFGQYCNGKPIQSDTLTIRRVGEPKNGKYLYMPDFGQKKRLFKSYLVTDEKGNRLRFRSAGECISYLNGELIQTGTYETVAGTFKPIYKILIKR